MIYLTPLAKTLLSPIISYTAHYIVTKVYNEVCVPTGFYGFLQGFLTIGSPACKTGLDIVSATQVSYSSIVSLGLSRFMIDLFTPSK